MGLTRLTGVTCLLFLAAQGCAHKHKTDAPPPAPSGGDEVTASTPAAATDEAPPAPPSADAAPAAEPTATAIVETPPPTSVASEETPPPPPVDATPAEPLSAVEAPAEVPQPVKKKHHKRVTHKEISKPLSVAEAAAAAPVDTTPPPPAPSAQTNAMNQAPPPEPVQQKAPPPRKVVPEAPREPAEQKTVDEQPIYMKPQVLGPAALVLAVLTGISIIRRRNNS